MKKWFHNLKVSQKLALITIFFIMPDSVMLYMVVTELNENIHFARWEQKGNDYQRPLESLLEYLSEHRLLAQRARRGDPATSPAMAQTQRKIDEALEGLRAADSRQRVALQFTEEGLAKRKREHFRPSNLCREWQELKSQWAELDATTCADRHVHLIADVRGMITHAGDLSNLILDPDLDTYYLMDVTLLTLPQHQDRLGAIIAYGDEILRKPVLFDTDRRQLAIDATLLKESDLDRVVSSIETALNEDKNFYGSCPTLQADVPPVLREYRSATEAFIELTQRLVGLDKPGVSAEEYVAVGTRAREASFRLWRVADRELDVLLQRRIGHYESIRAKSLILSALALAAAIGLVSFITRSISGPLRQQAAELGRANEALLSEVQVRQQAEEELRHNERQLSIAQQIAHVGSWEWDLEYDRVTWSEENFRISGLEPHAGTTSFEANLALIHPDDRPSWDTMIRRCGDDGTAFSFEHRIIRPDGTQRFIHQRGEAVRSADQKITTVVGTAQDITESKVAEAELEATHKKLLEASRQAGMAEVATGVLHNVGNVLNSVNVSVNFISEKLRKSHLANLPKIAALLCKHHGTLGEFITNDPKGKKLPAYIAQLAEHLTSEQQTFRDELDLLRKHVEHIKDIVAMQQNYATVSGVTEVVQVSELVEDTLRMNAGSLVRHDVQVVRDYGKAPPITTEKHKVLQILVNLVRNAKHACDESGRTDKKLFLRIAQGNGCVKISLADNGVGIPPQNLTRIFNHGFTTRKDGHGFGLHSGALAARELGGSLTAHSDGAGRGATFTLELPLQPPGANANETPPPLERAA